MTLKKGLIIGNSHVAMIAKYWQSNANHFETMELEFFAQPGDGPDSIDFDGSIMRATDPELRRFLKVINAKPETDLNDFNFLVVVACGLSIYPLVQILQNSRILGWPSSKNSTHSQNGASDKQAISSDLLRIIVRDALEDTLGAKLVKELRSKTSIPIYIVAQPLPSELIMSLKGKGQRFREIDANNDNIFVYQAFKSAMESVSTSVENTTPIFQPEETITRSIFTSLDFTTGAVRLYNLGKKQADNDTLHANHHYGHLILDKLAAHVVKK